MITEDYVSYETAQLLKNKGFDELCYACYEYFESGVTLFKGWPFEYKGEPVHNTNNRVKCPTLQMAMKWLRDIYKLCIVIEPIVTDDDGSAGCLWRFSISKLLELQYKSESIYECYEVACEEAIKYCLEKII